MKDTTKVLSIDEANIRIEQSKKLEQLVSTVTVGSFIYMGDCMNSMVNGKFIDFLNDEEAIKFFSNYEADVYKLYSDGEYIHRVLIHTQAGA